MVRGMQRVASCAQQFYRLADAAGLVNAALLADGQVHGQVQKRVVSVRVDLLHISQGTVQVGQLGVVFGVFVDPTAYQLFQGR